MEYLNEIWPSIQIIFEQKELIQKENEAIATIKAQIGYKPATTKNIIKFMNSKNMYELDDLGIDDRTETILEVKKVLTKKSLILQLEEKCHSLETTVQRFFSRIEPLT